MNHYLRPATRNDLPRIDQIFAACKRVMHARGLHQWLGAYPDATDAAQDILNGTGFVWATDERVDGYAAVIYTGEPTYDVIEGSWLTDGEYAAIHRVGVDPACHGQGMASAFFAALTDKCAADGFAAVRIDTHADNRPMRAMLTRSGLLCCGVIHLEDGAPRVAYERILTEPVIRPVESRDWESYLALCRAFYDTDAVIAPLPEEFHQRNFREMLRPGGQLKGYLFIKDNKAVGFANVALNWSTEAGGQTVWIEDVYVRPECRGMGFGTAFFARLDRDFARTSRRYRLEVEPENERAVALYRRYGFRWLPYSQMVKDLF